jgi:hypothetical protein
VRTGGDDQKKHERVYVAMELFIVVFILLLALASAFGLTTDSRDSADWKPTDGGWRWRPRSS